MGYPTQEEEIWKFKTGMEKNTPPLPFTKLLLQIEELLYLQQSVREISVDKAIKHYIVKLVSQNSVL